MRTHSTAVYGKAAADLDKLFEAWTKADVTAANKAYENEDRNTAASKAWARYMDRKNEVTKQAQTEMQRDAEMERDYSDTLADFVASTRGM